MFLRPVREKTLLPEKEISNLFGVVDAILPLHQVPALSEGAATNPSTQEVLKELRKVQTLSAKEVVLETAEIFCRRVHASVSVSCV